MIAESVESRVFATVLGRLIVAEETLATVADGVITVERVASGELATVLGRPISVDIADCINPETGFDPVKTAVGIDRIEGVTVEDGVIIVERVESGEFAAVLERLIPLDVADCTNAETRFDSMEPFTVIGSVESGELAAVLVRLTAVEVALCWTAPVRVLKPEEPIEPLD